MLFRNAVTADVLNDEKVEEGREEECESERARAKCVCVCV